MLRSLRVARLRALTTASAATAARRIPIAAPTIARGRRSYATPAAATATTINYEPAKEAKHLKKVLIANRCVE